MDADSSGRTVLVTGANGQLGRRLCLRLLAEGWAVRAASRRDPGISGAAWHGVGDLAGPVDWAPALAGVSHVLHGAGAIRGEPAYLDAVNRDASERLARAAAAAGVARFVYVSSLGAQAVEAAERGAGGSAPLYAAAAYPRSKWRAEQALRGVAQETGLPLVVMRPPAIYGAGGGKVAVLARAVRAGLPLPFAAIRNRRSFIHVDNAVDALLLCLTHPALPGGTYAASDGEPLSTAELVRRIAVAVGRPARLFPVPPALFRLAAALMRRPLAADSLVGDFVADEAEFRSRTGWHPPLAPETALARALAAA